MSRFVVDAEPKTGARWELAVYAGASADAAPQRIGHLVFCGRDAAVGQDDLQVRFDQQGGGDVRHAAATGAPRYSPYAPAVWAQVLPTATKIGNELRTDDIDTRLLSIQSDGARLHLEDTAGQLALKRWDQAWDEPMHGHIHVVLVTRPVTAADGSRDSEAYVGAFERRADGALAALDQRTSVPAADTELRARILLVQVAPRRRALALGPAAAIPPPVTEPDFWSLFFPSERVPDGSEADVDDDPLDAAMRIVGIGDPFGASR